MKFLTAIVAILLAGVVSAAAQNAASSAAAPQSATQPAAQAAPAASQNKIDPAKEADIRHLLEVAGTKAVMMQMMESMTANVKPMLISALPPGDYREKLADLFLAKFQAKANLQHLLDLAISAYDRHFTHEEIKGLIKFYESPLGKKAVSELPQLMDEMTTAGREWGQQVGRESMQEVLAEHPEMVDALNAAGKATQQK
jgi:hypothetical protein